MIDVPILVIDDDIDVLSMLETSFTTVNRGFSVFTATTANGGYVLLKEKRPAIVILDVRLARTSGMDLLKDFAKYFEQRSNIRDTPRYIVITAYPDERIEKEAREVYKVDAFLLKPFTGEQIRRAVAFSLEKALQSYLTFIKTYASEGISEESLKEKEREEWRHKKLAEDVRNLKEREK